MDTTETFFSSLDQRQHALLKQASGTIRFDLSDDDATDHVFVTIKTGEIAVSDASGDADCVVSAQRTMFNRLTAGQANAMATLLRGAMTIEGDAHLLLLFQRLFPASVSSQSAHDDAMTDNGRSRA